jgi:hypothetical protein
MKKIILALGIVLTQASFAASTVPSLDCQIKGTLNGQGFSERMVVTSNDYINVSTGQYGEVSLKPYFNVESNHNRGRAIEQDFKGTIDQLDLTISNNKVDIANVHTFSARLSASSPSTGIFGHFTITDMGAVINNATNGNTKVNAEDVIDVSCVVPLN